MADLVTFVLCFATLCLVGCLMTRKTSQQMHDQQHYYHQDHLRQMEEWRRDGRLPNPEEPKPRETRLRK